MPVRLSIFIPTPSHITSYLAEVSAMLDFLIDSVPEEAGTEGGWGPLQSGFHDFRSNALKGGHLAARTSFSGNNCREVIR